MMTTKTMSENIKSALKAKGYEIVEPKSDLKMFSSEIIEAIAEGVVKEIQANAKANVSGGSSAGMWSIQ